VYLANNNFTFSLIPLQLQMNEVYKNMYLQIQQQLVEKVTPLYLFKNVVRNGQKGSQVICFSSITFVDILNDPCTKSYLLSFAESTSQVKLSTHWI
jgi:hypothetical protein